MLTRIRPAITRRIAFKGVEILALRSSKCSPNFFVYSSLPRFSMKSSHRSFGFKITPLRSEENKQHESIIDESSVRPSDAATNKPKTLLIDGTQIIHRSYHATASKIQSMTGPDGTPLNGVYVFTRTLLALKQQFNYDYIAVCFDSGPSFRKNISADYKATRIKSDDALRVQFPIAKEATKALGISVLEKHSYEADDLLATYADIASKMGHEVIIVCSDKDLLQLISDSVSVYDPVKKVIIDKETILNNFGVEPQFLPDIQALTGDASDNVKGVKGIGIKTASRLIKEFGSINVMLENVDKITPERIKKLIQENAEQIKQNYEILVLKKDANDYPLDFLKKKALNKEEFLQFCQKYQFDSIAKKIKNSKLSEQKSNETVKAETPKKSSSKKDMTPEMIASEIPPDKYANIYQSQYEVVDTIEGLDKWIEDIKSVGQVAISTQLSIPKEHDNVLCGISLSITAKKACFIPLIHSYTEIIDFPKSLQLLSENVLLKKLKEEVFENESILKIGHDVKQHIKNLHPYGVEIKNFDDIMVMSYVLYCGKFSTDFPSLIENVLKLKPEETLLPEKEVLGIGSKKLTFSQAPLVAVTEFVCQQSDYTQRLYRILKEELDKNPRLTVFYQNIELPLVTTLAAVELNGVLLDTKIIEQMKEEYEVKIKKIHDEIKEVAGDPDLNINSNQQLGDVIFNKLGLGAIHKPVKSEKTSNFVVNKATLEKMANDHPLPRLVLEYRALTKLYSTYIVGLQRAINPYTGRVHTTFQNALTVTGRLSSVNPNLQNIPSRTPEGRKIRKCFIASPGHVILKADYSQVELRILAEIANIDTLKEAFMNGKDVHSITASQVFKVPVDQVDKPTRNKAKAINFGIIYGMSEYGLSKQINVTIPEARKYIKQYFAQYPGIKNYMSSTIDFCRRNGFVNTFFGRRCWIPDINDKNSAKRGFAERTSINTPIQGTSADITKIAMNRIYRELKKRGLKTKMILQVHDEIVYEVPNEEIEIVQPLIKKVMESAAEKFKIPLTVDVNVGEAWGGD